jgi:hypothetical protein
MSENAVHIGYLWQQMFQKSADLHFQQKSSLLKENGKTKAGKTKEGSITVPLTSCLTGLESRV